MTQNDIIGMAKQSGASADGRLWLMYSEDLESFYKLAIAKEQARCCSIVYGMAGSDNVAQRTVDAIRGKK